MNDPKIRDVIVGEVPQPAPVVKVTECVGRLVRDVDGDYIDTEPDMGLREIVPAEAKARGPRGRFRITVEFWPEGDAKP